MDKKWTKEKKKEVVNMLTEEIKNSIIIILGSFSNLSVGEMEKMRSAIKEIGGNIMVVKNNLLEIVFKNLSKDEAIPKFISGPTFVIWSNKENEIEIIKSVLNFKKDTGKIEIKGGFLNDEIIEKRKIEEIGNLPGRKELYGRVVYLMKAPLLRLLNSINSPIIRVLNVLKYQTKKEN